MPCQRFSVILLISRGATKTERIIAHSQSTSTFSKYCGSSRAQAIMSALSDRINMARGAQGINIQFSVQHIQYRAQPHKHIPTKRNPRGCSFGHPRIWDFRDPRPSIAFMGSANLGKLVYITSIHAVVRVSDCIYISLCGAIFRTSTLRYHGYWRCHRCRDLFHVISLIESARPAPSSRTWTYLKQGSGTRPDWCVDDTSTS